MTSTSNFFDVVLFLLSSLLTGPSFMSLSSLVLELWQFSFIRDWPEIWNSEIPTSEFFLISGDWSELWIPNLARMSLIECYGMLQNFRVTAVTFYQFFLQQKKMTSVIENRVFFGHSCNIAPPRLGLSETHRNLVGFSRSGQRINLSQWTHNAN